ncbi:MAG: hypothetical protein H6R25_3346 [Proteobacteria bacterium]|nr:hypothetical protein [Pseudomonadota bacterium]
MLTPFLLAMAAEWRQRIASGGTEWQAKKSLLAQALGMGYWRYYRTLWGGAVSVAPGRTM